MSQLSPAGQQLVQELSQRHHVSPDAVTHMLIAVSNGNGTMAQFNHPEFGGGGQWMRGGMTMVSDLFNNQLKFAVDSLCSDLANELANQPQLAMAGSFQSQSQNGSHQQAQASGSMGGSNPFFVPDPAQEWWPKELGSPNAVGNQNDTKYAYFANARRLAVSTNGDVWVYDTGDHQIGGFGQQQGPGGSISFSSQFGTVNLSSLPVVMRHGQPVENTPPQPSFAPEPVSTSPPVSTPESDSPINEPAPSNPEPASVTGQDSGAIFDALDKLGSLHEKGYLTEEEFQSKKAELLSRL